MKIRNKGQRSTLDKIDLFVQNYAFLSVSNNIVQNVKRNLGVSFPGLVAVYVLQCVSYRNFQNGGRFNH